MYRLCSGYINSSVSRRLAFYIIGVGLIVAALALAVRLILSYQNHYSLLQQRVEQASQDFLPLIESALITRNDTLLTEQLSQWVLSSDVRAVRIYWRTPSGVSKSQTYPDQSRAFSRLMTIKPPMKIPGGGAQPYIQKLDVDLSLSVAVANLRREGINNSIIIFLEALMIAVILIRLMKALITRHLRDMASYSGRLGLDKLDETFILSRDRRLSSAPDELDDLALALNNMRHKLHDDLIARQLMELSLISAKEDESRSRRKRLEAEASSRAKGQFIATVSHEIRTPMNGIIGMIDLLGGTSLNDCQRQYIETIKSSGTSLISVINDILDYSKIEADKLQLDYSSFDLDRLVDECIQLFSATSTQNHIELLSTITASTPRFLYGDPTRLRQIILNLLGNAFKFTREGHVSLRVSLALGEESQIPMLHFSVTDTGIGIAKESQGDLFQAFNQADSTITREFGGTGLGLAIAQNLVQLMGGEMGVDSELGKGASFWFTATLELAKPLAKPLSAGDECGLGGLRILLVNSGRMFNASIVQYCQSWRIACKMVFTAEEALLELGGKRSTRSYDVVLVNYELPDQSGESLIAEINAFSASIKCILICRQLTWEESGACRVDRLLTRPVTSVRLKQVLVDALIGCSESLSVKESQGPLQFASLRVLVAEDNPVNCMVIEGILKTLGITPVIAKNGEIAYNQFVGASGFDLIFMDCEMPVMDGFAATQKIRQWERKNTQSEISIIALTAHVESEHRKRVFACGMDYYLSKPVTVKDVDRAITDLGFQYGDQEVVRA